MMLCHSTSDILCQYFLLKWEDETEAWEGKTRAIALQKQTRMSTELVVEKREMAALRKNLIHFVNILETHLTFFSFFGRSCVILPFRAIFI